MGAVLYNIVAVYKSQISDLINNPGAPANKPMLLALFTYTSYVTIYNSLSPHTRVPVTSVVFFHHIVYLGAIGGDGVEL